MRVYPGEVCCRAQIFLVTTQARLNGKAGLSARIYIGSQLTAPTKDASSRAGLIPHLPAAARIPDDNVLKIILLQYALVLSAVIVMQIGAAVAFAKSAPTISATVETELNKLVGKYDYVHTRVGPRHRVTPVKNQFYDNSTVLATTLVNLIQAWVGLIRLRFARKAH